MQGELISARHEQIAAATVHANKYSSIDAMVIDCVSNHNGGAGYGAVGNPAVGIGFPENALMRLFRSAAFDDGSGLSANAADVVLAQNYLVGPEKGQESLFLKDSHVL